MQVLDGHYDILSGSLQSHVARELLCSNYGVLGGLWDILGGC